MSDVKDLKPDLGAPWLRDPAQPASLANNLRGFALTTGIVAELISVAESSFQDEQIQKIARRVPSARADTALRSATGTSREKEWYANIVDMNIIPINIHALMRGVPLASLYNYTYTFDQLACSIFGESLDTIDAVDLSAAVPGAPATPTKAFLKLLLEPYANVGADVYGQSWGTSQDQGKGLIVKLFRGETNMALGRPKFLSDQVFGKCLFGNLVPVVSERSRGNSPATTAARQRGVQLYPDPEAFRRAVPEIGAERAGDSQLIYLNEAEASADRLKGENVPANERKKLSDIGRMRFDTRFVRNLVFITNVLRTLRLKLGIELTQYRNVLVDSHSLVNPSVTEYGYVEAANRGSRSNPAYLETPSTRQYLSDRDIK